MNLINSISTATIDLPLLKVAVGFSRPFYLGDNSPLNTVAFLCASFRAASGRAFRYGVIVRAAFGLTVPRCGTANPDNHAAQCLAALGGVCSPFNLGFTMPQNKSAQNSTTLLNPDFSHRLGVLGHEATIYAVSDAVYTLVTQATSVLHLVSGQFVGDEIAGRYSDEIIYHSLQSVIASIDDIQAIVEALYDANQQA